MVIEVKELCAVDYIHENDVNNGYELAVRTVVYESSQVSLLEALREYEYEFDIDNVIDSNDEFDGSCNDVIEILSVKKIGR